MRQLVQLAKDNAEYTKLGYQIFGICPERPGILKKTVDKLSLPFKLLSDNEAKLMLAFGVARKVSDEQRALDIAGGADIEADSGHKHHLLPIHAAYLLGTDGKVKFAMPVTNHTQTIDLPLLLQEARKAAGK